MIGKKIKKEEKIENEKETENKVEEKVDEYLDGWKRCQADFENYKKRQAQSQKDLIRYSTQNIVLQILPVIDNFQASTSHIPEDQKENPWVTGIMYIQKQLEQVLVDNGVEEIVASVGDNFDPVKHEAIPDKECQCDKCDCENEKFKNKIRKVILKGYKIGDRVIRPARVVVE
jgi:molecular chaperone GrpE